MGTTHSPAANRSWLSLSLPESHVLFTPSKREGRGEFLSCPVGPALLGFSAGSLYWLGCGCFPIPVSTKCCSFASPVPAMTLAHLCCHSEEPVPECLAKVKLAIIVIKKTNNPPRHIMQSGKESEVGRAWLASKSYSTCLSTH